MFRYRAWDGTQAVEPLSAEQVLTALADTLLTHSIEQTLDRAIHRGLNPDDGAPVDGLDALRERLRNERRELEQRLANDEQLRELTESLKAGASGGDSRLDEESSRLLDALAADPATLQRLITRLDRDARSALQDALGSARPGADAPDGVDLSPADDYSGSLLETLSRLDTLDRLEADVRSVRRIADIESIDPETVRSLLGDRAADQLSALAASLASFATSGYLRGPDGRAQLSARALQIIGDELLAAALQRITMNQGGDRILPHLGQHELTGTTREYQFGDPLSLDLSRTVLQAVRRGGGLPVRLDARDFAIFEREDSARAATVLAIDLSRSMGERGYLLAARKLALALVTLVRTRFPRDRVLLLGFSESARTIEARDLPDLTWDRFGFGTNVQEALRLARTQLASHRGMQRNLVLLTDGEPTAYRDAGGVVHFSHPPSHETIAETLAEGDRLRRDGVSLTVCVLSNELQVVRFAEQLTQRAAGSLIVTAPDDLASAVILRYATSRPRR